MPFALVKYAVITWLLVKAGMLSARPLKPTKLNDYLAVLAALLLFLTGIAIAVHLSDPESSSIVLFLSAFAMGISADIGTRREVIDP